MGCVVACFTGMISFADAADQAHTQYFEQLRQRGLFSLAEGEAISRLEADKLSLADKTQLSIELSRTLMEHAAFVTDEQREELWQRARTVVQDLLDQNPTSPRSLMLEGQLAVVAIAEATWLCGERLIRPFDDALSDQVQVTLNTAIQQLSDIEKLLTDPSREAAAKRNQPGGPTAYELRSLLHQARWQIGLAWFHLAELAADDAEDQTKNIANAEQFLRRLTEAADEPLQSRVKVLLAACARLKRDFPRATQMLASLEKSDAQPELIRDAIAVEQARLLLGNGRPDEAAQLLLKVRSRRQRLTGEMWFLQTRALIALAEIAATKKQEALAASLQDQIKTTVDRCQSQVGGFWARRCRQLWDNSLTAKKYGPELDGLMQQARHDFTTGRVESSLEKYAAAEKIAVRDHQTELAMELGFTRASILLEQKQYELAAADFLRLVSDYPSQQRTARAHLLGTYALGRLYDEKKSQPRREAYTEALDRHLQDYANDVTVNDARLMKAQLEEQRLQATQALPLYLEVESTHARAAEAAAGAARCYETILKRMQERGLETNEFQREAMERLGRYLAAKKGSIDQWTMTDADVALRLASISLMSSPSNLSAAEQGVNPATKEPRPGEREADESHFDLAQRWLDLVSSFLTEQEKKDEAKDAAAALRQRMQPLRTVTLSARGRLAEAEQSLDAFAKDDVALFSVIETWDRWLSSGTTADRATLAGLQLKAVKRVTDHKDQLSPAQRARLDQLLINASLATGDVTRAIESLKRISDSFAKDAAKQQEVAERLSILKEPEALKLAKQCWRRVESLTKPGSSAWMSARLHVLRLGLRQGQFDEARKLMQVTRVLYPELGGEEFKQEFDAIEAELRQQK